MQQTYLSPVCGSPPLLLLCAMPCHAMRPLLCPATRVNAQGLGPGSQPSSLVSNHPHLPPPAVLPRILWPKNRIPAARLFILHARLQRGYRSEVGGCARCRLPAADSFFPNSSNYTCITNPRFCPSSPLAGGVAQPRGQPKAGRYLRFLPVSARVFLVVGSFFNASSALCAGLLVEPVDALIKLIILPRKLNIVLRWRRGC